MLRTRICSEQKWHRSADTKAIIARGATQLIQRLMSISSVTENTQTEILSCFSKPSVWTVSGMKENR